MALSQSNQASVTIMWLMAIGIIVCIVEKSPWGFLFLFAFLWFFFALLKSLTDPDQIREAHKDMEMQPLDRVRPDMTLGELLARY